jgi:hypothetical protein
LKTVVPVAALMGRYYSRAERQWRGDRDEKTPESVATTGKPKKRGSRKDGATAHNVTVASCGRAWDRWSTDEAIPLDQARTDGKIMKQSKRSVDGERCFWTAEGR